MCQSDSNGGGRIENLQVMDISAQPWKTESKISIKPLSALRKKLETPPTRFCNSSCPHSLYHREMPFGEKIAEVPIEHSYPLAYAKLIEAKLFIRVIRFFVSQIIQKKCLFLCLLPPRWRNSFVGAVNFPQSQVSALFAVST